MNISKILQALVQLAQTKRLTTLVIGLLGAAKLITDTLGLHVITNPEINAIANAVASIVTVISVFMSHTKYVAGTPSQASTPVAVGIDTDAAGSAGAKSGEPVSGAGAPTATAPAGEGSPQMASDGYARP
ncbi:hypothetical protein C7445_101121 [Alicyclobacillus sacchari]|uniref:Uncharacterized protein n=1 Tax=Alicyclobacillus sacchari TaxID=392010 RepID=A0A4R8LUD0_9BACL|nr:hypothetical protein [Alicyclobacillus sacchari]TDY51128.1 hypothetical protein C7445_101121 [Alicyclobacillus sacchari]GMA56384.1 hypothetical protein GCM10025858_08870 [Alicyclobacillus sacchari]